MHEERQDNPAPSTPPEGQGASRAGEGEAAMDDAQARLSRLQSELAEWRDKYLRSIADFQNFQRRALQHEQSARQQGVAGAVERLIPVLDHFDVALGMDPGRARAEQVMQGVRVIREEFIKALTRLGVHLIEPVPGDEFRPGLHEAIMQQPAEGVRSGHVAMCFQPGYALSEQIIRAAKVGVAP